MRSYIAFFTTGVLAFVVLIGTVCRAEATMVVDVVIMSGQSNMTGLGSVSALTSPYNAPQNDVQLYWGDAGQDDPSGTPYAGHIYGLESLKPNRGNNGQGCFGPELSFGRKVADTQPSRHLAIIKQARSGTTLYNDWNPVDDSHGIKPQWHRFTDQVAVALQAMRNAGQEPHIKAMLWLQGEDDATNTTYANAYQSNLTAFIAAVRSNLSVPDLPFVIARIQSHQPRAPGLSTVRAAQVNVAATVPHVSWFNTDDLPLQGDATHFTSAGQITLGQRFAGAYLTAVPEASTGVLAGIGGLCLGLRAIVRLRGKRKR
jgi:hypothetical protein